MRQNILEKAAEFVILKNVVCGEEAEEQMTELELSGLDAEKLEFMTAGERRRVLEEAGLIPDEYDF